MGDQVSPEEFLERHLIYEIEMLDYAGTQVLNLQSGPEWNVHYEAFCVHCRCLYDFLRNKGKNNAFNACEFANFRAKRSNKLGNIPSRLDEQVLHNSRRRTSDASKKLNDEDVRKMHRWVREELEKFQEALNPEFSLSLPSKPEHLSTIEEGLIHQSTSTNLTTQAPSMFNRELKDT